MAVSRRVNPQPSWSAGGSPVGTYTIYVSTTPGVPGHPATGHPASTTATVGYLADGTVYYFMVTAVNRAGKESPFSIPVSAEPTGSGTGINVGLSTPTAPAQLIALLAAVGAMGVAGVSTLITRRGRHRHTPAPARPRRTRARGGQQAAAGSDVRAVTDAGRPEVPGVRDTGREPTHTIRLVSDPGVATTRLTVRRL